MNVRIFWVHVMECMGIQTGPRFILSSRKVFLGNGIRSHVSFKGKISPQLEGLEEDWTHDTASHRMASPTHYQLSYSGPLCLGWKNLLFYLRWDYFGWDSLFLGGFLAFPSYISGVHHFWVRFLRIRPFFNPTIKVVTFCLHGWCVLGVFLLPTFTRLGHERQDLLSPCD